MEAEILNQVIAGLTIAAILGAVGFIIGLWRCVKNQGKRGWRQSNAMILMAETQDEMITFLHPDKKNITKIKPKIDRLLRDSKGNL